MSIDEEQYGDPHGECKHEIHKLEEELAIAREALKFYADPLAWCTMGEHAYADIGKVARSVLAGAEPKSRG